MKIQMIQTYMLYACCVFFEFNHVVLLIEDSKLETRVKTGQDKTRKKTFMLGTCKNTTGDAVHWPVYVEMLLKCCELRMGSF